ncbi:MAG: hypothetical protein PHS14_09935 [Elusimicrobia bacterium]|nr:hypothetical protein [Elusimicrobiota bacterium]
MIRIIAGAACIALLAFAPPARAGQTAEEAMAGWPEPAKTAARITMAKYGNPDEIGADALVWRFNGPWARTVVHRRGWPHYADMADKDYLENTAVYRVPGGGPDADARFAEMSSRSESESLNFLVLNLAYDIIIGKRTMTQAREFAARTLRLAEAGKSSPYLEGLLFE